MPDLVDVFITRFAEDHGWPKVAIYSEAFKQLMAYDWHGNLCELENILKRALVMCTGSVLLPEHFPALSRNIASPATMAPTSFENRFYALLRERVDDCIESGAITGLLQVEIWSAVARLLFELVLRRTGWNRSKVAEILGINRNTLHSKMEEYGIQNR